jgi:hypothetical protein
MNIRWRLLALVAAVVLLTGMVRPARGADLQAIVTNLTGHLDVEQDIPCGGHVSKLAPVNGGLIDLLVTNRVDQAGNRFFVFTRMNVRFDGLSISGNCGVVSSSVNYTGEEVQLSQVVGFVGTFRGGSAYSFTIPKEQFLVYVVDVRDGVLERSLKRPSQDVVGTLDLNTGAFRIQVVTSQTLHFQGGCVLANCLIDERDNGTVAADVAGGIMFPDADHDGVPDRSDNCVFVANPDQSPVATPTITAPRDVTLSSCTDVRIGFAVGRDLCDGLPVRITSDAPAHFSPGPNTVTWTATDSKNRSATDTQIVTIADHTPPAVACMATHPLGNSFVVTGKDDCGVTLTLGSYVIGNGEQIKIEEVGQPGIRLQNVVGKDGVRKFLVGKGQGVIVATDAAGNSATAICR